MNSPTASQFATMFNPAEETHVRWLKKMSDHMENLDPLKNQKDLSKLINLNPMKVLLQNPLDWVFIHFSLALKYTNAVFKGEAWIPPKK